MTLALYGKSRRRQGGLLLAGLLAVLVAVLAGVATITSVFAHHAEYHSSGTCDGWKADAGYVGGSGRRLIIIENVKIGGQDYQSSWSTGFSTDSGTSGGIQQYTGGSIDGRTLPTSGAGQVTDTTNVWYWYGIDSTDDPSRPEFRSYDWTIFNRSGSWPAGAFSGRILQYTEGSSGTWSYSPADSETSLDAPTRPSHCDRTIRIHKVVQGSGAPAKTFSYTISPAGISGSVSSSDSDNHDVPKNVAHTVKETEALSAGWSFVKYTRKPGLHRNCSGQDWSDQGTVQGDGVSIPADSNDYTVCIYNQYTDPAALVLSSSACVVENNVQYAQFHFLIPNDVNQGAGGTLSGTYNDGAAQNFGPINEDTTPSNGHPDWTFTLPFGSGASVEVLTATTSTGWTWPTTGAGHEKDTVSKTSCQPVVLQPGIEKVAADTGYSGGYAHWLIKVNNTANTQAVDVKIEDSNVLNDGAVSGGTCTTDGDISDGTMICTVNASSTLVVPVKRAVSQQCLAGAASNSATISWKAPGSNEYTQLGTVGPVAITIPPDSSLCDKPGITKVANTTTTSNPADVKWTVTVTNPATGSQGPGTTQTVYIKDSNVNVVSGPDYTGSASCTIPGGSSFEQELTSANGVQCSMPNASTITFTVKPAGTIARTCPDQTFNNTASIQVGDGNPINAIGPTITLEGNPSLCTRNLEICKVVVGNGDGITMGGEFKFTAAGTTNVAITASEPASDLADGTLGAEVCTTVQVPTGPVTVFEWDPPARPANWNSDDSLFPQNSVYGFGSKNGTANVPADVNKVVFRNKTLPKEVKVTFSKYICETYKDVPNNQGPGGQNDLGKNDGPAALTQADLGPKGPTNDNDPVTPANDNEGPSCALATEPWDFKLWTDGRSNGSGGTLLQTVTITGSQQVTLNASVVAQTLKGQGAYVEEVYRSGYGFGSLKCYTDHLNDDNWEWLNYSSGIPTGDVYCIAYNVPADKEIVIEKQFLELPGGYTTTANDVPAFTLDPAANTSCAAPVKVDNDTWTVTCTVPYDWNGTVTETPKPGWKDMTGTELCIGGQEPTDRSETGALVQDQVPGADFVFCNAPYGTVIVNKLNSSDSGPNFTATISGLPSADILASPLNSSPTIAQGSPSSQTLVPLGNQAYSVTEVNAGTAETCGSGATDYLTIVQAPADTVLDTPGEIQEWTIVNQPCGVLGQGGLVLAKYRDNNGDGTANGSDAYEPWTIKVTGPDGYDETFVLTAAQMPFLVGPLAPGNYTVSELTASGWKVIGLRVDNGALVANASQTTVAVDGGTNVLRGVVFYNQPRVNIEVNKTEISLATPAGAPGNGWSFTLTGCGITPVSATTGTDGKATFSNLPPAVGCSYTVTETVKSGWSAINPVQVTAPTAAGQTVALGFTNVKIEVCTDCVTIVTPTPTPTTPTVTPEPSETPETPGPSETPETPAVTPETTTPGPTEDTAGARTPGPGQTPIAPSTGNGFMGTGAAGANMLLALVGLLALSLGTTILALGRKSSRR